MWDVAWNRHEHGGRMAKMQKKRITLKGSFTVEASIIVPVIVLCLAALIWLVFYLRNSVRSVADADMMLFTLEKEAVKRHCEGEFSYSFKGTKGYYGLDELNMELRLDGRSAYVSLNIAHNFPSEGILGGLVSGIRTISIEKEESVPMPQETARIIKAAGEIIGRIKQAVKKDDK